MLERSKALLKFIQCQRTRSALVPTHFLCVYSFPRNSEFSAGKVFSAKHGKWEPAAHAGRLQGLPFSGLRTGQCRRESWHAQLVTGHDSPFTPLVSRNRFSSLKLSRQLIPPILPITLQSQKLVLPAEKLRGLLKKFAVVLAQEVSMDISGITEAINSVLNVNK